jgi:putative protease
VGDCASCGLHAQGALLKSIDGDLFPVRTDVHGRTRIYDARPLDAMPQVPDLVAAGVKALAVDATLLDAGETARQVARLARAIRASKDGTRPPAREDGATTGHLFSGIG